MSGGGALAAEGLLGGAPELAGAVVATALGVAVGAFAAAVMAGVAGWVSVVPVFLATCVRGFRFFFFVFLTAVPAGGVVFAGAGVVLAVEGCVVD